MDITGSIIIGVISGITTSTLVYIIVLVFNRIVIPWYQDLIYKGVDISGEWKSEIDYGILGPPFGAKGLFVLKLNQKAHSVKGSATGIVKRDGQETVTTYNVEGEIGDRILHLTLKCSDKQRLGIYTELLEVSGHGNVMQGWTNWYSGRTFAVTALQKTWVRSQTVMDENKFTVAAAALAKEPIE